VQIRLVTPVRIAFALFSCLFCPWNAHAVPQQKLTISGVVGDVAGAQVVGAKVTLTGGPAKILAQAKTNSSAAFSFPDLAPGEYNLSVESPGYRTWKAPGGITLGNQSATLKPILEVAETICTLEVSGTGQIETQPAIISGELVPPRIRYLPMTHITTAPPKKPKHN